MKTQTALLLVLCASCYRLAQWSAEDFQGFASWSQSEIATFASDPIAYGTTVYAHLEQTGSLKWLVFALCAKGCSWYFKKKRISRAATAARLEEEKKKTS